MTPSPVVRLAIALGSCVVLSGIASTSRADLLALQYPTMQILRFNETTGAPLGVFADLNSQATAYPINMVFGPDGNLYVGDYPGRKVLRYDGQSGAFLDVFADTESVGGPSDLTFDAQGDLFISTNSSIVKIDGASGMPIDTLVSFSPGHGCPHIRIGPDGNLYAVYTSGAGKSDLQRFNAETGAFIDTFVEGSKFSGPNYFSFSPSGEMFLSNFYTGAVVRYAGSTPIAMSSLPSIIQNSPAINPDLVTYARDGSLIVIDAAFANPIWQLNRYDATTGALINNLAMGDFASIVLTPNVPEPATATLLASAALFAVRRWRAPRSRLKRAAAAVTY